jgi:hypothetical protein
MVDAFFSRYDQDITHDVVRWKSSLLQLAHLPPRTARV